MKNTYLILSVLFFMMIVSCKKEKVNYITETESAAIILNKNIDSSMLVGERIFNIVPGTKTVFKYNHTWANNTPGYVDAFTDYTFAFAIDLPSSEGSFVLTDDQIKQAPAFYRYFTGDGSTRWVLVTQGKITGTKINSTTWNVVIHLFAGPYLDINKNFIVN